jgi:hypothetical protein
VQVTALAELNGPYNVNNVTPLPPPFAAAGKYGHVTESGHPLPDTRAVSLTGVPSVTWVADGVVPILGVRGMNFFVAGPDPPGPEEATVESVDRITLAVAGGVPLSGSVKVTLPVALAVKVPGVDELMVTVHVAVLPDTTSWVGPQVLVFCRSGVGVTAGVTEKPLTLASPPGMAVTVIVKV